MSRTTVSLDVLLDPVAYTAALEDALRDMRDAYLAENNGCFPVAQQTPALRLRVRAMVKTYALIGGVKWPMVKGGEPECFPELRAEIKAERRAEAHRLLKPGEVSEDE